VLVLAGDFEGGVAYLAVAGAQFMARCALLFLVFDLGDYFFWGTESRGRNGIVQSRHWCPLLEQMDRHDRSDGQSLVVDNRDV